MGLHGRLEANKRTLWTECKATNSCAKATDAASDFVDAATHSRPNAKRRRSIASDTKQLACEQLVTPNDVIGGQATFVG